MAHGVGQRPGESNYYFTVGSVEGFERKLEQAQASLGIKPKVCPFLRASALVHSVYRALSASWSRHKPGLGIQPKVSACV